MEEIRIKIDDEYGKEFDKLKHLLFTLKINYRIEIEHKESLSGVEYKEKYLKITYDEMEIFKKLHRSPGRKKKHSSSYLTVTEVRKMIKDKGAEEVARKLGYSRRTLFRRLQQAEKWGDKYIY